MGDSLPKFRGWKMLNCVQYTNIFNDVFGDTSLMTPSEYKDYMNIYGEIYVLYFKKDSSIDVLRQFFDKGTDGIIHDGDIISPIGRDTLLSHNLVCKCLKNGEHGFQACTYSGWLAYKTVKMFDEWVAKNSYAVKINDSRLSLL